MCVLKLGSKSETHVNLEDESEFANTYTVYKFKMTITPESIEKRRIFSRDLGHYYLQQIIRDFLKF